MKKIKQFTFLLSLIGLLMSCTSEPRKSLYKIQESKSIIDSTITDDEYGLALKDYIKSYNIFTTIDTTFNNYRISVVYYCANDSSILIPSKYSWSENKQNFRTHNFLSKVIIVQRNDTVFTKQITKELFSRSLPKELKSFGVLMYPEITLLKDSLCFSYSVSIPLTDIGMNVEYNLPFSKIRK